MLSNEGINNLSLLKDMLVNTWTSYKDYAEEGGISDREFALSLSSSKKELLSFLRQDADEKCMEYEQEKRLTDERAAEIIRRFGKVKHSQVLQNIEVKERNRIIEELKTAGLSIRQIERLTGINRGTISRA